MDLFSLGMFCIDEIHTSERSYTNIIGGAGTFAALGAGVLVSKKERRKVGFLCDEGFDFPASVSEELYQWGLGIVSRKDQFRVTTKAWNKFVNDDERLFKYLSPKRQVFPEDLPATARASRAMHLICSPQRCEEILASLIPESNQGQIYVWEPVPTQCIPSQYESLRSVVEKHHVHVLSPNALEAAALVGKPEPTTKDEVEALDLEHFQFAQCIVLRCGSLGSYLRNEHIKRWFPAYFAKHPERVIDPTGAGNAFTGAIGLALAQGFDWETTLAMASVAASFMIEQVGPPVYDSIADTWNGETGSVRMRHYLDKII